MDQNAASLKVLADSQKTAFPYVIRVGKLAIEVHKNVFSPKHFNGWKIFHALLPDTKGTDVLEVGTGTGVTAAYMAAHGARSVMALDINPHAVKNARTNARRNSLKNMTVRESNIFSALKKTETFDTIYWNTPFMYAPHRYKYRNVLERGLFDPGYRITDRFLKGCKKHLRKGGRVLFGTGNFGDIPRFLALAKKHGYRIKVLGVRKSREIKPVTFDLYELTLPSQR